jgi:hypothetical protein
MLNHTGEILLALVMVLFAFLSYWLVWSLGLVRPLGTENLLKPGAIDRTGQLWG